MTNKISFENYLIRHATLVAIVALTLLTIVELYVFYQQKQITQINKDWVFHTYEVRSSLRMLLVHIDDAVISERAYLIGGNEQALDVYNKAIKDSSDNPVALNEDQYSLFDRIFILKQMVSDNPLQQSSLTKAEQGIKDLRAYMNSVIGLRRKEGMAALQKIDVNEAKRLSDYVRGLIFNSISEENRLLSVRAKADEISTYRTDITFFGGISIFYVVVVIAIRLCQKAERNAQAQLLQNAAFIESIVNTIIDALIVIDSKGIIQSANKAVENIFGYAPSQVIGKNVKMLMPPPYQDAHDDFMEHYRKTGKSKIIGTNREVTGQRKDGTVFPFELGISELKMNGARMFVGIVHDISERKQAEIEREKYIAALQRSNRELDDFSYIASHDLKEPLRGLSNNAMFLKEDFADILNDEAKKRLDRMTYLCQRMEKLVDDLLYFSRLGRQELAIQPTDLNEVIKDIKSMMETSLREANAEIITPKPLPTITCDLPRITELFRNLITNAVKYNKNPEKRIEIGCIDAKSAPFKKEAANDTGPAFYVRDNGVGIPEQFYDDIFRIFKRLNEENDAVKGTGVGLTFVRKIVERHGGHIWLDSKVGSGTTFYFTLNSKKKEAKA